MTRHLAKSIPYKNTHVSYGETMNDIAEMLKESGAVALRWTETPDSMKGVALPVLEFIFPVTIKGVEKQFGVRVQPPLLVKGKRQYGRYGARIEIPDRNASMRLLFWYMKAKLEAVQFGLDDLFEAFMSRVISQLPDRSTVTLSEAVKEHPEVLQDILPTFEIKAPQLTSKAEPPKIRSSYDADYKVVDG